MKMNSTKFVFTTALLTIMGYHGFDDGLEAIRDYLAAHPVKPFYEHEFFMSPCDILNSRIKKHADVQLKGEICNEVKSLACGIVDYCLAKGEVTL